MKKHQPPAKFWEAAVFPLAVAHRGGNAAGIEKENSLAAFRAAYDLGYRWFETDVVPTKDGKLLAIHGRGFQRRPNKDLPSRLKIQQMMYEEVLENITVGGEKVLTLEELLDAFPDCKFFLDPKTLKAAPILARNLIQRPQDIDRVWVGSFLPFNNSRVYKAIKKATGSEVGLALLGSMKSAPIRLAAYLPIFLPLAAVYVRWTRAGSVRVFYPQSSQKFVQTAHKLGLKTGVYTPNSKKAIKQSLATGTDVIMSDNVRLLKTLLKL